MNQTNEYMLPLSYGLEAHLWRFTGDSLRVYLWLHFHKTVKGEKAGLVMFTFSEIASTLHLSKSRVKSSLDQLVKIEMISFLAKAKTRWEESIIRIERNKTLRDFTVLRSNGNGTVIERYRNGKPPKRQRDKKLRAPNRCLIDVQMDEKIYSPSESMLRIFDFWISKQIKSHRQPTQEMERAFRRCGLTEAEVLQAIDNYAAVLADPESFFSYRWGLDDFLGRKNGARKFVESDILNQFKKTNKPKVYGAEAI